MKEIVTNYLWIDKITNIDNKKLYETCCHIDKKLKLVLPPIEEENFYGCFTSYYHQHYNLFTFACPELHKLYGELSKRVLLHVDQNTQYYMRCWVNLFEPGSNIDWHAHWEPEFKAYHGFYCVNTEGPEESYTDYRIPGQSQEVRVMSEDGLLVFGKSDDDRHRSSPWSNTGNYRITIAFDVIPINSVKRNDQFDNYILNNYIPLFSDK